MRRNVTRGRVINHVRRNVTRGRATNRDQGFKICKGIDKLHFLVAYLQWQMVGGVSLVFSQLICITTRDVAHDLNVRIAMDKSDDRGGSYVTIKGRRKRCGQYGHSRTIFSQNKKIHQRNTLPYMLTSIGKNLFGHTSGVRASSMHNNCFLEVCYIIVNHLVQFFETIQSETEGSEPQKPGGLGPRIALLMRFFV